MQVFLKLRQAGATLIVVCGVLIEVGSLVAERGLQGMWASVVVVPGLSCSAACGILLDHGWTCVSFGRRILSH